MVGGDVTCIVVELVLPLLLYCTWYLVMGRSLEGAVQVTLRAGLPELAAFTRVGGGFTLVGTVSDECDMIACIYVYVRNWCMDCGFS